VTVQVKQLHSLFVGKVEGTDLTRPLPAADLAQIQAAIDAHAVLVFHGPKLSEDKQLAFARNFGPLETSGILKAAKLRVHEKLADVSNLDENDQVVGELSRKRMSNLGNQIWHTDSSFKATPAKYSALHAHTVTPEGGETQFADMRAAYDALPAKMKARIEDLVVEHSIFTSRAKVGFTDFTPTERSSLPPVRQRLVRVHPATGRRSLYLASHASHVIGWNVPDGMMLLLDLMEHATQREFVHTHAWAVGDLVMWDNRCTMHRGRPFDPAHRRDMRRATVEDDGPTVAQAAA
jgi:alpha-ketoglutarate-dependent 2,4-dichlorophenoxyacetate dioxygenase